MVIKKLILFSLFCFCKQIFAQPTINNIYVFGDLPSTIFSNVIATDSCYYISGKRKNTLSPNLQEGLFVRLNLDGTVYDDYRYANDSVQYIFWEQPTLIKTNDHNFALTFAVDPLNGPRHFGFVKLKPNGDTLIFKTYLDIYNDTQDDDVFQPGGFLQDSIDSCYYGTINISKISSIIAGVALIKLDPQGNLLWYKKFYGSFGSTYFGHNSQSLIKTSDNKLIIGGCRYRNGSDNSYTRYNTVLTITDTAGNLLQTKIYPDDHLALQTNGFCQTIDHGYLFTGINGVFTQNGNAEEYKGRLVKLDSSFTEAWRIEKGLSAPSPYISFKNILKVTDSTYVAIGESRDTISYDIAGSAGWMIKFNIAGDVIWERFFQKVLPDNSTINFPRHALYSADITADSGFVMVGQARNSEASNPAPVGQLGWLVKTDKHGCLVPGCEQFDGLSIGDLEVPEIGLSLYPNPANNELFVYYANSNHNNSTEAALFNIQGQQVMQFPISSNNTTYMLDVSNLGKGVYVLQVADNSGLLKTEKVVVE